MIRRQYGAYQAEKIRAQRRRMARENGGDALQCCLSCQKQLTDADRDEETPDGLCADCRRERSE